MQCLRMGALLAALLLALGGCGSNDDSTTPGGAGGTGGVGGIGGEGGDGGTGGEGGGSGEPACDDGEKNGDETDVDCGGSCAVCEEGASCNEPTDCRSGTCEGGRCVAPPTCEDGEKNGTESDVDCGGACEPCAVGDACRTGSDCTSLSCSNGVCVAPTCHDAVKNGDEAGVDCGGSCPTLCGTGSDCNTGTDCQSGICSEQGKCVAATCSDQVKNGGETDVDCGGPCAPCANESTCTLDRDCQSGACVGGICVAATCSDGRQNQGESDVDCGGPCARCAVGRSCVEQTDCATGLCVDGTCAIDPCTNGVKDGDETDVDCGGSCSATCADGKACFDDPDCTSGVCFQNVCQVPTCDDRVQNGAEVGVDCGGGTCAGCADGSACNQDVDCASGVCADGVCAAPACGDGVVNGDEECEPTLSPGICSFDCEWTVLNPVMLVARNEFTGGVNYNIVEMFDPTTGAYAGEFVRNPAGVVNTGNTFVLATEGPDGKIWISMTGTTVRGIHRFDVDGTWLGMFVNLTNSTTYPQWSGGFALDASGSYVWVPMRGGIFRFDANTGAFVDQITAGLQYATTAAYVVTFAPDGNLIAQMYDKIHLYNPDLSVGRTLVSGAGNTNVQAVVTDDGNLLVVSNTSEWSDAVLHVRISDGATLPNPFSNARNFTGVALLDDGRFFAAVNEDTEVGLPPRVLVGDNTPANRITIGKSPRMVGKGHVSPGLVRSSPVP